MKIDKITLYRVCNPIKRPYVTAFGSQTAFNSILVKLESDGLAGWGESAPGGGPLFSYQTDRPGTYTLRNRPGLDVVPNPDVLARCQQEEFSA